MYIVIGVIAAAAIILFILSKLSDGVMIKRAFAACFDTEGDEVLSDILNAANIGHLASRYYRHYTNRKNYYLMPYAVPSKTGRYIIGLARTNAMNETSVIAVDYHSTKAVRVPDEIAPKLLMLENIYLIVHVDYERQANYKDLLIKELKWAYENERECQNKMETKTLMMNFGETPLGPFRY